MPRCILLCLKYCILMRHIIIILRILTFYRIITSKRCHGLNNLNNFFIFDLMSIGTCILFGILSQTRSQEKIKVIHSYKRVN